MAAARALLTLRTVGGGPGRCPPASGARPCPRRRPTRRETRGCGRARACGGERTRNIVAPSAANRGHQSGGGAKLGRCNQRERQLQRAGETPGDWLSPFFLRAHRHWFPRPSAGVQEQRAVLERRPGRSGEVGRGLRCRPGIAGGRCGDRWQPPGGATAQASQGARAGAAGASARPAGLQPRRGRGRAR